MKKKGAMELSMSTVVIVVLALTMLIMGFILIRSIMCGAIGSVKSIEEKTNDMINNLFSAQGGEVVCLGEDSTININPGMGTINIPCSVNARDTQLYSFKVEVSPNYPGIDASRIIGGRWVHDLGLSREVSPAQKVSLPVGAITLPDDAPEGNFQVIVEVRKDGNKLSDHFLNFRVSRTGIVTGFIC